MKILAISDRVEGQVYSEHNLHNCGEMDLYVGCGDLPYCSLYRGGRVCLDSRKLFISDKLSDVHAAISWASVAQ